MAQNESENKFYLADCDPPYFHPNARNKDNAYTVTVSSNNITLTNDAAYYQNNGMVCRLPKEDVKVANMDGLSYNVDIYPRTAYFMTDLDSKGTPDVMHNDPFDYQEMIASMQSDGILAVKAPEADKNPNSISAIVSVPADQMSQNEDGSYTMKPPSSPLSPNILINLDKDNVTQKQNGNYEVTIHTGDKFKTTDPIRPERPASYVTGYLMRQRQQNNFFGRHGMEGSPSYDRVSVDKLQDMLHPAMQENAVEKTSDVTNSRKKLSTFGFSPKDITPTADGERYEAVMYNDANTYSVFSFDKKDVQHIEGGHYEVSLYEGEKIDGCLAGVNGLRKSTAKQWDSEDVNRHFADKIKEHQSLILRGAAPPDPFGGSNKEAFETAHNVKFNDKALGVHEAVEDNIQHKSIAVLQIHPDDITPKNGNYELFMFNGPKDYTTISVPAESVTRTKDFLNHDSVYEVDFRAGNTYDVAQFRTPNTEPIWSGKMDTVEVLDHMNTCIQQSGKFADMGISDRSSYGLRSDKQLFDKVSPLAEKNLEPFVKASMEWALYHKDMSKAPKDGAISELKTAISEFNAEKAQPQADAENKREARVRMAEDISSGVSAPSSDMQFGE